MAAQIDYADVALGFRLSERRVTVSRETLIMFCGAALDFVGPHWSQRIARSVGLPDVIAHRSLIVAKALSLLNDWAGDPTAVVDSHARFAKPVAVPDDGVGAVLVINGVVESKRGGKQVGVNLTVTSPDDQVLATVRTVVQLA